MTRASCGKASVCWDLRRPAPVFCVRARVNWAVAPLGFEELWTIGGPVVLRVWLGAAGSLARGERDLGAKPTHFCDDFAPRRRFETIRAQMNRVATGRTAASTRITAAVAASPSRHDAGDTGL